MSSVPDESGFDTTVHLVQAAQGGDRQALEDLFTRYLPRVRQIVSLRMGRRLTKFVEFEDVTQESLLKIFNGLHRNIGFLGHYPHGGGEGLYAGVVLSGFWLPLSSPVRSSFGPGPDCFLKLSLPPSPPQLLLPEP